MKPFMFLSIVFAFLPTLVASDIEYAYGLPKDPKAPVIVLDYRGGFTPPKISTEPSMSILADGTVNKKADGTMTISDAHSTPDSKLRATIVCEIKADKATYRVGEVPKISVTLKNTSDEEVRLVGSLDGSWCQARYPICKFDIVRPDDAKPAGVLRCGYTNKLRVKDFALVEPGKTLNPYKRIDGGGFFGNANISQLTFNSPGKYTLRFVYSTKEKDVTKWRTTKDNKELVELLESVPKIEVKSNEITIEFEE